VSKLYENLEQIHEHIPHARSFVDTQTGAGWITDQNDNVYFRWGTYYDGVMLTSTLIDLLKGSHGTNNDRD